MNSFLESNGGGERESLSFSRYTDDDRVPIIEHSNDVERGLLLDDNDLPTSAILQPANGLANFDFSFATDGGFMPSELTLAGAQRISEVQKGQTHPKSSNFFDDL